MKPCILFDASPPPLFRKVDRRIVHCLRCYKPQENLPVHLAKICLKNSTPGEIALEVQKAKASSKQWMVKSRMWDYNEICALLPEPRSQHNMVRELISRGFFVTNLPKESGVSLGVLVEEADDPSGLIQKCILTMYPPPKKKHFFI